VDEMSVDIGAMQTAFREYFRKSIAMSRFPLRTAVEYVKEYANDPKSVQMHPKFPQKPAGVFAIFCQEKQKSFAHMSKEELDQFKDKKNALVKQCEEKQKEQKKEYVKKLGEFLEEHKDTLKKSHIDYVRKLIKNRQEKPASTANASPKKQKIEKPSAFDLYKRTKKDKYLDLDPSERDEKLLRHFKKLDEDKRQIFEDLAESS
jgi:hypothetical protein